MDMVKKIIDKILGKPIKLNDMLKPKELECGQTMKAERRSFASELGNGNIKVDEKKAMQKMREKGEKSKTKSEGIEK